jgi:hypothetical protein
MYKGRALYHYLRLSIQRCHFLFHGLDAFLKGLLFSDFTTKLGFLKLELMKFSFVGSQNIIPTLPIVLKILLLFLGVSPSIIHQRNGTAIIGKRYSQLRRQLV